MKNILKNWKFIFGAAFLVLFGLFYLNSMELEYKQPSKNWSRQVVIHEINNSKIKEYNNVAVTGVAIPEKNSILVLWPENNLLKYVFVKQNGEYGEIGKLDAHFNEVSDLKAIKDKTHIMLYALEGKLLKRYDFDYNAKVIKGEATIAKNVEYFNLNGQNILATGERSVKIIDNKGLSTVIDSNGGEIIDGFIDKDGIYKLAFVKTDDMGTMRIKYVRFNMKNNEKRVYEVQKLINPINQPIIIDSLIIGKNNNKIHIINTLRDLKNNTTRAVDISFDENNIKSTSMNELEAIAGYKPNLVKLDNESDSIRFLASIKAIRGSKTETFNIKEFSIRDGVLNGGDFYTHTKDDSTNQKLLSLGRDKFLVFKNISAEKTKIMIAGTNQGVIELAKQKKTGELVSILLEQLMSFAFALSYLLAIFTCIIFPSFTLLIIAGMFFLNWLEANTTVATIGICTVHVIAELLLTSQSIMKRPEVWKLTPQFMQNSIVLYLMVILIGLISYYCLKLRGNNVKIEKSVMGQYTFFAVINMILYFVLFFPYYNL